MKTRFILAAFAAAAMFVSCTEQALNPDGTRKLDEGGKTAMTFKLNLSQPTTKALDFNPDLGGIPANEQQINPADIYILIFNEATGILEVKEPMVTNTAEDEASFTTILDAGVKKIFVLANCSNIPGFTTWFNGLTVDNSYSPLTTFPSTGQFNAGDPQFVPFVDKSSASNRTFDITPLYTQTTSYGLPASTTNQYSYKLNTGVGIGQSSSANLATDPMTLDGTTYSQTDNSFEINMYFMVSKARLTVEATAISTYAPANISDLEYSIHNLSRRTNFILNVVGGLGRSAIFGQSYSNGTTGVVLNGSPWTTPNTIPAGHYLAEFDGANTPKSPVGAYATTVAEQFIYVPEATHGSLTRGMVPYYAISATYAPKFVISAVSWNPTHPTQKADLSTGQDIMLFSDQDYVYLRKDIVGFGGEILQGTCFKTLALLQQAVWLVTKTNPTSPAVGGGWIGADAVQISDAMALIGIAPPAGDPTVAEYLAYPSPIYGYYEFTGAQSYYRANVGGVIDSPTIPPPGPYGSFTGQITFGNPNSDGLGTLRGVAYDATITGFNGPGVPYEWMLDSDKPEPLDSKAEVTITVKIMNWAHATAGPVILE